MKDRCTECYTTEDVHHLGPNGWLCDDCMGV